MNDYTLSEAFDAVYKQEFSEFDCPAKHIFSLRHRREITKILYPHTEPISAKNNNIPLKKRVLIALLVILLAIVGVTASASISRGFIRKNHSDNTELIALSDANSPITIENLYYLPEIPEEYELYEVVSNNFSVSIAYMNINTGRCLAFCQDIKEGFKCHVDNEHYPLEEVDINGHYGLYLADNKGGLIIWDNDDYILAVAGDFTKDELLNLAKSAKI